MELDGFVDDSAGHVADADLLGVVGETPAGTKKKTLKKKRKLALALRVSFQYLFRWWSAQRPPDRPVPQLLTFYQALLGFTEFFLFFLGGGIGFYWVLKGLYWVLLGFTECYYV